jgi:hypothetical protein
MAYSELQQLSDGEFKRLCGVSRSTFAEMVEVLTQIWNAKDDGVDKPN